MWPQEGPSIVHPGISSFLAGCIYALCFIIPSGFSNISLKLRFPDDLVLDFTLYSWWIRVFLDSLTLNSDPRPYIFFVFQGYLVSQVVFTKFIIDIACVSSYCVILSHPITRSIIVIGFSSNFSFFPFLNIFRGLLDLHTIHPWYLLG